MDGTGGISSPGIGSGLDIQGLIDGLMANQNKPVMLLQTQEAKAQTTLSALGGLQSTLSQFQHAIQNLNKISAYQTVQGSVANPAVASMTATPSAQTGSYTLEVSQLAQAQTLIASGQSSQVTPIGVGTLSFTFGTTVGSISNGQYQSGATFSPSGASPQTVTIDASNHSLAGIADAINRANIGVSASIMNDGSNTPYRLALTSTQTGEVSSMKISVSGDAALADLLNFDPTSLTGQKLTQTSRAQNAQFTLNGLAISSATNTNSTVIPGATLNLLSSNAGSPTVLNISQGNSGAMTAIKQFVSAYNTAQAAISKATAYNSTTKIAGPLQGQNSILSVMRNMENIVNQPVPGAQVDVSMLAQIGITSQDDGTLSIDETTLQTALAKNFNGVASLFASNGTTTDPLISFQGNTSSTGAGVYAVHITQLATQATLVGSAAASTTITAGINDTLQVTLNGTTANITVAPGTYTSTSLAYAMQSAINNNSVFHAAGHSVSVIQTGGVLTLTSNLFGSNSNLAITGGNGVTSLLGSAPTSTQGLDVVGTIGGQIATGKGQILTSTLGTANGLSITVNGGSVGARGTMNYTKGYVEQVTDLLTDTLGKSGQITTLSDGLKANIKDIQDSIDHYTTFNQQVLDNLKAEFLALDVLISGLNNTSSFLTQQLRALNGQLGRSN